jgi:membrane protease YdiL (CAAX protease family)
MSEPRPFPSPVQASLLTVMGLFLSGAVATAVANWMSPTAALGFGTAIGLGVTGALGAASIPPPHGPRVGLRGFAWRNLLPILLLVPTAFLASEVDNVMKALLPAPDAAQVVQDVLDKVPTNTELSLLETSVVAVGLVPLVEEWFFRGVLQQGLVANLGPRFGILLTALLFAFGHGLGESPQSFAASLAQMSVLGLVLGYLRYATGSILPSTLLHAAINGLGVVSLAMPAAIAIPGYDAPGAHTPLALLVPSLLAVSLGLWLLARERPEPVPPVPLASGHIDD